MKTKKVHISDLILSFYIFSIILTQGTMYGVLQSLQQHGIDDFSFRALSLVMGGCTIIFLIFSKRIRITKNKRRILVFLLIYLVIYGLLNISRIKGYLEGFFLPFFVLSLIICFYRSRDLFEKFLSIYSLIIIYLSLLSLVFYIFGTLLHCIPGIPMKYFNNGWWYDGTNYYYLSFINNWQTINFAGVTIVRNIGIFMEAPGYATTLIYALWWQMFGYEKLNKRRIAILLTTVFTTFSAKAYVGSAIIIFLYLYSGQISLSNKWRKIRNAFLPTFICLVALGAYKIILTRTVTVNGDDSSFAIRMSDYFAAFEAWKDYPVFGCGFYNLEKLYTYYPIFRNNGTSTAGILNILAYGGIYMFLFYLIPFIKYLKHNMYKKNKYKMLSFIITILFLFITDNEGYSYMMLFLIAFGYMIDSKNNNIYLEHKNGGASDASLYNNCIS